MSTHFLIGFFYICNALGNIKVTIPIRLKYDGCKTVIHQPEVEQTELDPETMSPL